MLTALAPTPRDSAFWAGAARHPAPPPPRPRPAPPRPACGRPGAWGLGRWRRGGQGGGGGGEGGGKPRGARTSARQIYSALCVCSLVGPCAALWACAGWWVSVPGAVACGRRERTPHVGLGARGGRTSPAALRADLAGCEAVDRSRIFPEPCTPKLGRPRSHTLLLPQPPSRTLRSAAPPHTRGCLFLLGLSMLSLFGRLCHRLDAGNKVRPCV